MLGDRMEIRGPIQTDWFDPGPTSRHCISNMACALMKISDHFLCRIFFGMLDQINKITDIASTNTIANSILMKVFQFFP